MGTFNPSMSGWSWIRLTNADIGGGTQYPSDGLGGKAAGASAAERVAASLFSSKTAVLLAGWYVSTPIATNPMNVVIRDIDDTINYYIDSLEVIAAATTGNWDDRPMKWFPERGIYLPTGFGVVVSGTPTGGAVDVLFKVLR